MENRGGESNEWAKFEVYFKTIYCFKIKFCIYWLWFICLKFGLWGLKCFALEAFWHPLLGHYCRYRRRQAQINWRNDYEDGFSQLPWIIHFWSRVQIRNNKSWTTSAHDIHWAILKGKCARSRLAKVIHKECYN